MKWDVRPPYLNGGVIWYSGSEGASLFSDKWHKYWLKSVETTGRFRDQPSLNFALQNSSASVHVLEHCWNAQVQGAPKVAEDAAIWHLYLEWNNEIIFEFKRQIKMAQDSSEFDPKNIAQHLISKEHPWCSRTHIDDWLAKKIIEKNFMANFVAHWFDKTPLQFSVWFVHRLVSRVYKKRIG